MLLALTCALCTALPIQAPGQQDGGAAPTSAPVETAPTAPSGPRAADLRLVVLGSTQAPATAQLPQAPQLAGSGEGDHSGHSDHMTPMWIMMGVMVAVMVVGMGVYASNHRGTAAATLQATVLTSPASLAVPMGASTGGSSR